MEIFYIDINSFNPDAALINRFLADNDFKSEKRRMEYALGRFLVDFIAKSHYKMQETSLIVKNKKPQFANYDMQFSISHSKNIVLAAFDKAEIGVDVEYMASRDYESVLTRYSVSMQKPDAVQFYTFWTQHEAKIKLQEELQKVSSYKFLNEFILSVASSKDFAEEDINIYEIIKDNQGFSKISRRSSLSTLPVSSIGISDKNCHF